MSLNGVDKSIVRIFKHIEFFKSACADLCSSCPYCSIITVIDWENYEVGRNPYHVCRCGVVCYASNEQPNRSLPPYFYKLLSSLSLSLPPNLYADKTNNRPLDWSNDRAQQRRRMA